MTHFDLMGALDPSYAGPPARTSAMPVFSGRRRTKLEVLHAYVRQLAGRGDIDTNAPGFAESLRLHFDRLPLRYSLDVNIESLDVLSHQRLLEEARRDPSSVSFAIRPVVVTVGRNASQSPRDAQSSWQVSMHALSHSACS